MKNLPSYLLSLLLLTSHLISMEYRVTELVPSDSAFQYSEDLPDKINDLGQAVFIAENDRWQSNLYFYDQEQGVIRPKEFPEDISHYFNIADFNNRGDFIVECEDVEEGDRFFAYYQDFGLIDFKQEIKSFYQGSLELVFVPEYMNDQGKIIGIACFIGDEIKSAVITFSPEDSFKVYLLPKHYKISSINCFTSGGNALIGLYHVSDAPYVYYDDEVVYTLFSEKKGFSFLGDFGIAEEMKKLFPDNKMHLELQDLKMNEQGMISGLISEVWALVEDAAMPFVYHPEFGLKLFIEKQQDGSSNFFVTWDNIKNTHFLNDQNEFFFDGLIVRKYGEKVREVGSPPFVFSFEKGYQFQPKIQLTHLTEEQKAQKRPVYVDFFSFNDQGLALGTYDSELDDEDLNGCFVLDVKTGKYSLIDLQNLEFDAIYCPKINSKGQFLISAKEQNNEVDYKLFYHLLLISPLE